MGWEGGAWRRLAPPLRPRNAWASAARTAEAPTRPALKRPGGRYTPAAETLAVSAGPRCLLALQRREKWRARRQGAQVPTASQRAGDAQSARDVVGGAALCRGKPKARTVLSALGLQRRGSMCHLPPCSSRALRSAGTRACEHTLCTHTSARAHSARTHSRKH